MYNVKELWTRRVSDFWGDAIYYLRIIITGYMYLPILVLIFLAIFYHYLLTGWKENGVLTVLLTALMGAVLSWSPTRTFLQEADLIYLLPMEIKMKAYFRNSLIYSFIIQCFALIIVMALISPLYQGITGNDSSQFYFIHFYVFLLKGWNIYGQWQEQRLRKDPIRYVFGMLRFGINILVSGIMFGLFNLPIMVIGLGILLLTVPFHMLTKRDGYFWTRLVENERKSEAAFYSFIQWFMEVPHISYQVKRRDLWLGLFRWIPFNSHWTYGYLFSRSFIRYADLFHLYWRMYLVGAILLCFVENRYIVISIFFLTLILNCYQLSNAWHRLQATFWGAIYPVSQTWKVRGFLQVLFLFLAFQVMGMSLITGVQLGWMTSLVLLTLGVIFCYVYIFYWIKRRLRIVKVPGT